MGKMIFKGILVAGALLITGVAFAGGERCAELRGDGHSAAVGERKDSDDAGSRHHEEKMRRMRARFDARREADNKRWREIDQLGEKYRSCTDEQEKQKLEAEIVRRCGEMYDEQLKFGHDQLDRLKKRLTFLEQEQAKREKMRDGAIKFRVKYVLSGEKMPPPPPPPDEDDPPASAPEQP